MTSRTAANASIGLPAPLRAMAIGGASALTLLAAVAIGRATTGPAPIPAEAKEIAVLLHLAAVLPAIPLGLYVLVRRKGDARHRMLGRIWMGLMLATALSALFIRHLNGGKFSWLHLFVPLVIVTMARAITAARRGRIDEHKRHMIGLFLLGLLLPGLFAFLPGRLLWHWLVS